MSAYAPTDESKMSLRIFHLLNDGIQLCTTEADSLWVQHAIASSEYRDAPGIWIDSHWNGLISVARD